MDVHSFHSWSQQRDREEHDHIPESDKVVPLVAQAGARGMSRSEIGKVIDLERDDLDRLLAGLVQFGLLSVTKDNGFRVFRARSGGVPSLGRFDGGSR